MLVALLSGKRAALSLLISAFLMAKFLALQKRLTTSRLDSPDLGNRVSQELFGGFIEDSATFFHEIFHAKSESRHCLTLPSRGRHCRVSQNYCHNIIVLFIFVHFILTSFLFISYLFPLLNLRHRF